MFTKFWLLTLPRLIFCFQPSLRLQHQHSFGTGCGLSMKAITRAIFSTIQEVLHRILDRLEIRILDFSGEVDHIHLLVSIPSRYAISDLVNRIKTATSRAIRQKHAKAIAPFLWGNSFWSTSHCAASVGDGRSIESIKRYIQGQKLPS